MDIIAYDINMTESAFKNLSVMIKARCKITLHLIMKLAMISVMTLGCLISSNASIDSMLALIKTHDIDHELVISTNARILSLVYSNPSDALKYAQVLDGLVIPTESDLTAEIKNTIGLAQYVNEDYENAVPNLLWSLRLFEKSGNNLKTANVMNNLASVYQVRKEVETSVQYFEKALSIFEDLRDTSWIASVSANLGGHLMEYDRLDEAERHLERAITLFDHIDHTIYLGFSQLNLGSLRVKQKRFGDAIDLFHHSLVNVPYEVNPLIQAVANTGLGQAHLESGNLTMAHEHLLIGHDIAQEIGHIEQLKASTDLLARYYENTKDYKRAFEHQKEWSILQDSFLTAAQDDRLLDALKKYEVEQKEQEITLLSAENEIKDLRIQSSNRNLLLSLLTILAVSALAFQIYRSRRKTEKLNETLLTQKEIITKSLEEKDVLLREIHHRVKNNLQVVSSLLGIQSRKVKDVAALDALNEGRSRVQSMSLIHQNLYKKDNLTGIEMRDYFQKLVDSLFNTYNISSDEIIIESDIDQLTLDVDTIIPLGLVLNELISNALKYAFPDQSGKIFVSLKEIAGALHLIVSDNGVGMKNPGEVLQSDSYGYDLISSLVDKLEGSVNINIENGTRVEAVLRNYKKAA